MSHYVIIDGVLQKSNPETQRWAKRAGQAQPTNTEEKPDAVALKERERSDYEIIQELEETE